ncbi:MAG: tetratricopeptide repeat protein [Rhodoferax sp.]|nr:tetratricopeptide repeat protein [Rhodoferax sp.]
MIHVTLENFDAEVLATSATVPVLVYFWASWCGPCKTMGPLLEKAEKEYEGRFRLAKIDSDSQQELAQAFGVRSIPTCILLISGKPVDGFMGAIPQGHVNAFLDRHVPSVHALEAQVGAEDAQALLAAGDTQAALDKLHEAVAADPGNDEARYSYVKLLIECGLLDAAQAALAPALVAIPRTLQFEALGQYLDAIRFVSTDPRGSWPPEQFDALLAANKRDFDTRLAKARVLLANGNWTGAMDELLEIILRDKTWGDAVPRKTYVAILELLTPPKPKSDPLASGKTAGGIEIAGKTVARANPQTQLVDSYRRKLSMALH